MTANEARATAAELLALPPGGLRRRLRDVRELAAADPLHRADPAAESLAPDGFAACDAGACRHCRCGGAGLLLAGPPGAMECWACWAQHANGRHPKAHRVPLMRAAGVCLGPAAAAPKCRKGA